MQPITIRKAALLSLSAIMLVPAASAHAAQHQLQAEYSREARCRTQFNRYPACTRGERHRLNARFGLPPIETIYLDQPRASAVIVATASFKRGGGLALVFLKDRRSRPYAEVRRTPLHGRSFKAMRVSLPDELWDAVTAKARAIDTNLYDDDPICTGGAGFTFQTIDDDGTFRLRVGDVCGQHPGTRLFNELAGIVLARLPRCRDLAPGGYAEAWAGNKLNDCFMLDGERSTALAAYNFLEAVNFWSAWNTGEDGGNALLAANVDFSWTGRALPPNGKDLSQALAEPYFGQFRLEPVSYTGTKNGRVLVRGRIRDRDSDGNGPGFTDPGSFRAVWVRNATSSFTLRGFAADLD